MRQGERVPRDLAAPIESRARSDKVRPVRVAQTRDLARQFLAQASPDKRQELQRLMTELDEIAEYQDKFDQVEAAGLALETHRAEFEALLKDWPAMADRARVLFAGENFRSMRFAAEDIQRAFEVVGYPPRVKLDERTASTLSDAILHVANKERRQRDSLRLMSLMPDYVSAERFMDAWLIQYCAFRTFEALNQSNPFLAEMFYYHQ